MINLMGMILKFLVVLTALFTLLSASAYAAENKFQQQPLFSQIYDAKRNAFDDGRAALKLATETNRRVVIEIGGDWCVYCHMIDRFLKTNDDVANAFFDAFVLLKINVSDENSNAEFMKAFERVSAYPHMFVTEKNGKVIYSKDTTEFMENRKYSRNKFFEFINRWKPAQENG